MKQILKISCGIPKGGSMVEQSVQECMAEGILTEFLLQNRREVVQMSIFEYDQEAHMKLLREESREDGWKAGEKKSLELTNHLLEAGRLEDLKRAMTDDDFRRQLYEEFNI